MISRGSTLTNQENEKWWYNNWFTSMFSKESSEISCGSEASTRNFASLTVIFQNILGQIQRKLGFPYV